jgi:serine/threonine-protein kinase RsbT
MADEIRCRIASEADLVLARAQGRALALELGFSKTDATLVATAISEIARNILVHAGEGEVRLSPVFEDRRRGLVVVAVDDGPGIRNVESALELGYASGGGLGLGLPGARRLMDEFEVQSNVDRGTTVRMTKWRFRDELEILRENRRAAGTSVGGAE